MADKNWEDYWNNSIAPYSEYNGGTAIGNTNMGSGNKLFNQNVDMFKEYLGSNENILGSSDVLLDYSNFGLDGNLQDTIANPNIYKLTGKAAIANPASLSPDQVAEYNALKNNKDNKWLGSDGYISAGADILDAGTGVANAYLGLKNYELAKDQFAYEKGLANKNLANQVQLTNNSIQNSHEVGMALGSGAMSPDQVAASNAALKSKYVSV